MSKEGQVNSNISNAPQASGATPAPASATPSKKDTAKKPKNKKKSDSKLKKKIATVLDWLIQRKKIVFIISGALLLILVVLIIIAVVIRPSDSGQDIELSPQQEEAVQFYLDEHPDATRAEAIAAINTPVEVKEFHIEDFNIETSDAYDGYAYITALFDSSESSMYNGAVTFEGDLQSENYESVVNTGIIIDNINQIVERYNITDPRTLQLIDLQKADVYLRFNCNFDAAKEILEKINEKDLLESQKLVYYIVMERYCEKIGDEARMKEYQAKYDKYVERQ